jgi:peptidoglycan/LPS O-acetylase OafA/YrhL
MLLVMLVMEGIRMWAQHSGSSAVTANSHEGNNVGSFFGQIFLVASHGLFQSGSWNQPSWSISAEFTCYLLFAITRIRAATARGMVTIFNDYTWGVFRGLSGFGLGLLLFVGLRKYADSKPITKLQRRLGLAVFCTSIIMVGVFLHLAGSGKAPLWIAYLGILAASSLMIGAVVKLRDEVPIFKRLGSGPFGSISYSIYMIHAFIILAARIVWHTIFRYQTSDSMEYLRAPFRPAPRFVGDLWAITIVLTTCVAGWYCFRFIETPARKWLRRYFT